MIYIAVSQFLYNRDVFKCLQAYENDLNDLVKLDFVKDTDNNNECTLQLVDIKNIDLKHIHNLTNKISDINGDNRDNRDNETDGDNRNNRNDRDDKDNEKSSSHVLENTEHKKSGYTARLIALKDVYKVLYNYVLHVSSSELPGCITRFIFYSKVKSSIFIVISGVSSSSVKWNINAFGDSVIYVNYNSNHISNTISKVNKNINNIFIAVINTNVKESSLHRSMENDRSSRHNRVVENNSIHRIC
ncbi:hypothetical protein CIRG_04119 [Coccidioides immitis RMSCC 2394]|uniref:Uncharacterized protein n=1 Tax=Coccidioides immitis RMSCC 2394 TaxID=404692 RepID=A0A0J7B3L7_COCIT|nr:hypothetical protein CIRG_04119 [Coccidioides immitis RMSCC 2394]